jgi:putative phosphoribosyl transferase
MFRDRRDAGRRLAERLKGRRFLNPLVLAIPRGGVVVGGVLARELNAELDVVLSCKLRPPGRPDWAFGAVSETGEVYLDQDSTGTCHPADPLVSVEREHQMRRIAAQRELFRGAQPPCPLGGRSVIVTDDGILTGASMVAALKLVRGQKPHEVIVAVPVAAPDRLRVVREWCDEAVCLLSPLDFFSLGQYYDRFTPVSDAEVVETLRGFVRPAGTPHDTDPPTAGAG